MVSVWERPLEQQAWDSYRETRWSGARSCDISTARNEILRSKGSMARLLRSRMSFFPISIIVPPSAKIRHDSSSKSPVNEFRIRCTPWPLVASDIWLAKSVFRELKIRSSESPKVDLRNSRFSSVPTVAKIFTPLDQSSSFFSR